MLQQNDNFYLTEAFNKLKLLDEDAFDLSADKGVTDELQSFVADDIEAPYEEEIIDVDADNNDELADDYLGKIILQCECCHAKVYKDPAEIILSEENEEIVNEDETCPACGTTNGWKIIGKIEPFDAEEFEDESESEGEVEDEFSDDEIGEALKEALNEGEDVCPHCGKNPCECDEDCNKSLDEKVEYLDKVILQLDKDGDRAYEVGSNILDSKYDFYQGEVIFEEPNDKAKLRRKNIKPGDKFEVGIFQPYSDEPDYFDIKIISKVDESLTEKVGKSLKKSLLHESQERVQQVLDDAGIEYNKIVDNGNNGTIDISEHAIGDIDAIKDVLANAGIDSYWVLRYIDDQNEGLTEEVDVNINDKTAAEDAVKLEDSEQEPIKEELKDVQSEDDEKLEDCEKDPIKEALDENKEVDKKLMAKILFKLPKFTKAVANKYGKDAGKSKSEEVASLISANNLDAAYEMMLKEINESLTEDVDEVSVKADDQEVNVSVEPDGKLNISIDPKAEEENVATDAEMIAPLTDEEQAEITGEAEAPVEEAPVEDEFEVDEFDEDSFDELGESFLKRVYENVNSFNTSKVAYKKGQLVVEGLIKFNSGKEKTTKFVFEGFKNTKRGKTLVAGINEMFSKSNKAFLLKGNLADKKFVSESLTYNYTAKSINEANESDTVRVYGRAVIRK